jgi:hypothetical protein
VYKCAHEVGEFITHIFARKKANGKCRVILNLKPLNHFLVHEHFKMEHVDFVCDLVQENDWFGSIDLSDAYFAVSIHMSHWKYLKFFWNNELHQYKVRAFGLSVAPRIFTRVFKAVLANLRGKHGIRCSIYIDDLIVMSQSKSSLVNELTIVANLLTFWALPLTRKSLFLYLPTYPMYQTLMGLY